MEKPIRNTLHELFENKVLCEFAKLFNTTPMELIEANKSSRITEIRHLYCKLRYENHGLTHLETGREIGRHYTTVQYGIVRINDLIDLNDQRIVAMWDRVKDIAAHHF